MANPAWRKIGGGPVPERPGVAWTPLVENVTPGKVIKIEVPRIGQPAPADAARAAATKAEAQDAAGVAADAAAQRAADLVAANEALATAGTGLRTATRDLRLARATAPQVAAPQVVAAEQAVQQARDQLTQATTRVRDAATALERADAESERAAAKTRGPEACEPADQLWTPKNAGPCTADGKRSPETAGGDKFVIPGAPGGCLIARIGGSSVDITADSATLPSRILFSVGRVCVIVVPDSVKGGPIFLAANDVPDAMDAVAGQLQVNVYEAL